MRQAMEDSFERLLQRWRETGCFTGGDQLAVLLEKCAIVGFNVRSLRNQRMAEPE